MFNPKYHISNRLLNNLAQIAEAKGLIAQARILPKQEVAFKKKAAIRMAQSSTSIEGNILNQKEVEKVFKGQRIYAPRRDEIEVKNYQAAFAYLNQLLEKKPPLDLPITLKTHALLMKDLLPPEKVGTLRKGSVYVVNVKKEHDEVLYEGPPAKQVKRLLEALYAWMQSSINQELSPILRTGIWHYQFVSIHPFSDGNGRVARFLQTYHLFAQGFELKRIYALDSFYNQDRARYYQKLDTGETYAKRKNVDLTDWLEYFTEGFVWELGRIREQISLLQVQTKDEVEPIILDQDEMRLIDFVASMGKITSADVADILNITQRAAQMRIKKFVKQGIFKKQGQGPSSFYVLNK